MLIALCAMTAALLSLLSLLGHAYHLRRRVRTLEECVYELAEAGSAHLEAFSAVCRALDGNAVLSGYDEGKMQFVKLDIAFGSDRETQTWRFSKN